MTLKASIVGMQVKQIKNALQYLAKIGSELLIEALPDKIIFRSINSSRSAYASVTYTNTFFDAYNVFGTTVVQAGVLAKQALALFRTQRILKIYIELDSRENKMVAAVSGENGLEKQYKIPCMDSEILQTSVDKDSFPTCVNAAANDLNRLLSNFQSNLEEVTIIAMPEESDEEGQHRQAKSVQLHSFVDPAKGQADQSLHTQLSVDTHEVFLDYRHNASEASDVTFNLKDFKAVLVLCEGLGANVAICFDQPGSPLLVEPLFHSSNPLEEYVSAELVLATLLESARLEISGPATVAAAARRRLDTPGEGNVPGDTPWRGEFQAIRTPATGLTQQQASARTMSGAAANTAQRLSRFRTRPEPSRFGSDSPAQQPSMTKRQGTPYLAGLADDGPQPSENGDALPPYRRTPQVSRLQTREEPMQNASAHLESVGPGRPSRNQDQDEDAEVAPEEPGDLGGGDLYSFPSDPQIGRSRSGGRGGRLASGLVDDASFNSMWMASLDIGPVASKEPGTALRNGEGNRAGITQDSEWQDAGPVERRYLAAEFEDDDDDMDDVDAIPGTP